MPLFRLNSNDIYILNLRLAEDDSEITNAVISASGYDQTQFERIANGMTGTPITGFSNVTLSYKSASEIPGHYRGAIAATVGLSVGTRVWVNYIDDGTYGINVWVELEVERRFE